MSQDIEKQLEELREKARELYQKRVENSLDLRVEIEYHQTWDLIDILEKELAKLKEVKD